MTAERCGQCATTVEQRTKIMRLNSGVRMYEVRLIQYGTDVLTSIGEEHTPERCAAFRAATGQVAP